MGPSERAHDSGELRDDIFRVRVWYCIIDEVDSILIDEQDSADHLWAGGTTDQSRVATALKKRSLRGG